MKGIGGTNKTQFSQLVSEGKINGYSFIEKFGENPVVDIADAPEDIWGFGGIMTFSTSNAIDTISSSSTLDTGDVFIEGLAQDGNGDWNIVQQIATLDGQNKVVLDTPLIRFYRGWNDGTDDIVGIIYIYEDDTISEGVPTTDTLVRGVIINGNNQTEMAIYTVPSGKEGYFYGGYVAISRTPQAGGVDFTWRIRLFGKTFRVQSRIAVITTGNSSWVYKYTFPVGPIPAKTDIKLTAESTTVNGIGCSGGFTMLLKDI